MFIPNSDEEFFLSAKMKLPRPDERKHPSGENHRFCCFLIFRRNCRRALFAHTLQYINPRMFDILKSTDILIMVYLGGIASIAGSIIGAIIYTILLEILRPLGIWRMVLMPLMLVLLMIYRPRGIMGLREAQMFIPLRDLLASRLCGKRKRRLPMPLLEAKNVTHRFDGLCAVDDFNFTLASKELVGIIGPNGAGKTTLFNLDHRRLSCHRGDHCFSGNEIVGQDTASDQQTGYCPHLSEYPSI